EAGGQFAGGPCTSAALGGAAGRWSRDQLFIDLRLVLPADHLVMRLMQSRQGRDARGTVVLPPQLPCDRLAILVDDDAGAVRAPRGPEQLAIDVEDLELDESTAHSHAGGKLMTGAVDDGHARVEHAALVLDLADADACSAMAGLIDHVPLGGHERFDSALLEH